MPNYNVKLENLKSRRQDIITKAFSVNESFNKIEYGASIKYALEAMEPISSSYTQNTYRHCERIQNSLKPGLLEYGIDVSFKYQGSVPTNTHIKNYSDIDMLTVYEGFFTLEPPQTPIFPYAGNPIEDLKNLRKKTFRILDTVYTACKIDDTGSKCITISGGSLDRTIDIIPCNWYNSLTYSETKDEDYRGIQVLDRDKEIRIINYPFMHIYWINTKDLKVNGGEKRMIRLLKSLKADADTKIDLSSYDIASLVYRMDDFLLHVNSTERLQLLHNTNLYLLKVINDSGFRETLYVANGHRKIFCSDGAKVEEASKLQKELQDLILSIAGELKPHYGSLEKSNIYY